MVLATTKKWQTDGEETNKRREEYFFRMFVYFFLCVIIFFEIPGPKHSERMHPHEFEGRERNDFLNSHSFVFVNFFFPS